jgi:hypothetical protein
MKVIQVVDKTKRFISNKLSSVAIENPMIGFIKPVILRVIDNNTYKLKEGLSLLTDEYGEIDMYSLLGDITNSLMDTRPFIYNLPVIGDIEIGGGLIKVNIPFSNKRISLSKEDLDQFKELFKENEV